MRPAEEECAAALGICYARIRQTYGPRFFDLVVVDSWYANGPFLKTVVEELGWPVIAVLKQERYDIYQEAAGANPEQAHTDGGTGEDPHRRQVEIWDVTLAALQRHLHPTRSGGAGAGTVD